MTGILRRKKEVFECLSFDEDYRLTPLVILKGSRSYGYPTTVNFSVNFEYCKMVANLEPDEDVIVLKFPTLF